MLFNSYVFIFVFLPIVVASFHLLRGLGHARPAMFVLVAASLVFYAWWDPRYLLLLTGLMLSDLLIARQLRARLDRHRGQARLLLVLGIAVNLGALGYFKYANFFVDNLNQVSDLELTLAPVVLPIGISFFTFQKVAFLIDLYQRKVSRVNALDYALFVTFFPQLIAGPIVHHSEVIPQFASVSRVPAKTLSLGVTIFVIGLAKKVLLADTVSGHATPYFDAAFLGTQLDLLTAWTAALAYTAQIYFDFSAYSDMAIGIGLMFGISLPINFDSPYKSFSIIEFWRRWHITLSRFLRDYLYVALGGNRRGQGRRYVNLYLTMLLGGIWHGAGWTFLVWGGLHGLYLIVNHAWRYLARLTGLTRIADLLIVKLFSWALTFVSVVVAWVFFRAGSLDSAISVLQSMFGLHGLMRPDESGGAAVWDGLAVSTSLLALAVLLPNTQQLTGYLGPAGTHGTPKLSEHALPVRWRPSIPWALFVAMLLALSVMHLSEVSEFIYFQF